MPTLRIDHEVHTYDRWEAALDGYADVPPRVFTTLGPAANPPPPPTASGQIRSSRPNRCPPTTSRRLRSAPEHSSQRSPHKDPLAKAISEEVPGSHDHRSPSYDGQTIGPSGRAARHLRGERGRRRTRRVG